MTRALLAFGFLLSGIASLFSQSYGLYGNEWIDYSAPYLKMKVAQDRIYRINYTELNNAAQAAGFSLSNNPAHYEVWHDGKQQYIYIEDVTDPGTFGPGDYVEFYGERNKGELEDVLYEKPEYQTNPYVSLFNDTATYFITWKAGGVKNRLNTAHSLAGHPPKENYYIHEEIIPYGSYWSAGKRLFVDTEWLLDSRIQLGEGWTDAAFNGTTKTKSLSTTKVYTTAVPNVAEVTFRVVSIYYDVNGGYYHHIHHLQIGANGVTYIDTIPSPTLMSGQPVSNYTFNVPLTSLKNGSGTDDFFVAALGPGVNWNAIASLKVKYARQFDFNNKNQFYFTLNAGLSGSKYIEIQNFDDEGAGNPILYDLTQHRRIRVTPSAGLLAYNLPLPINSTSKYYLSSNSGNAITNVVAPQLSKVSFKNYTQVSNQGNYIIITHNSLRGGNDEVQAYANYRKSGIGGSYNPIVVDVRDISNEFGYGISKSPLALRNFINYVVGEFHDTAKAVFIIGEGRNYVEVKSNIVANINCLVPTFGYPESDMLLTAKNDFQINEQIPIGRLAVNDPSQIATYLSKVMIDEQNLEDLKTENRINEKIWTKHMMHFAGGSNAEEQAIFQAYVNNYRSIAEGPLFGADVQNVFKSSSDPIQYNSANGVLANIHNGLGLMTFFGHSAPGSFDVSVDDPEEYDNLGRQPILISNGCFSGQIFTNAESMSEQFVLAPNGGGVGFLSTSTFGEANSLKTFTLGLYYQLSQAMYGAPFGEIIQHVVNSSPSGTVYTMLKQQNVFHGDPVIRLPHHDKPDYAIEPFTVSTDPQIVTVENETIDVLVDVYNIGRAINDTIEVKLEYTQPNGNKEVLIQSIKAPLYKTTVTFTLQLDSDNSIGNNSLQVYVDEAGEVDEIFNYDHPLTNNKLSNPKTFFISAAYALPVIPYEYSIVNKPPDALVASTPDPLLPVATYYFELDTTELFNSPLKKTYTTSSKAGTISWKNPQMAWQDHRVYYWRVAPAPGPNGQYLWQGSSFIYIADGPEGWNQSHYFQFLNDSYENIELKANRQFDYVDEIKTIRMTNGYGPSYDYTSINIFINNILTFHGGCGFNGLNVMVFDTLTGLPWNATDPIFSGAGHTLNSSCSMLKSREHGFMFRTYNNAGVRQKLITFLRNRIPDGAYFVVQSNFNPGYDWWYDDTSAVNDNLYEALSDIGIPEVYQFDTLPTVRPWVYFGKKGDPSVHVFAVGESDNSYIDTSGAQVGTWDFGFITSTDIGPALAWDSLIWDEHSLDFDSDSTYVHLYGLDPMGQEDLILANIPASSISISNIDAAVYPKLRLKLSAEDDSLKTSTQLSKWRVLFDPVPEAAVNSDITYLYHKDTMQHGDEMKFAIAVQNIGSVPMDSMLVRYTLINANNLPTLLKEERRAALNSGEHFDASVVLNSLDYAGQNTLVVEANPDHDQPEQHHFNNLAIVPFYVQKDKLNPLLDVTFDGRHIMDGDIVSAKPEIIVSLKDENRFLALDDTLLLNLYLEYPGGQREKLNYNEVLFQPADPANLQKDNVARVAYNPQLTEDGKYRLIVEARDKTGNESGNFDFQVSFEVINKPSISNVLNYPNPFSSSTRFVFTITGSDIPDQMKIQIMTVSGRIVREIMLNEMGSLYVGTNITDYAWDGTDEFGDPLANGLYLYRVTAYKDGKRMDQYTNATVDRFFDKGFGKMYLAR